MSSKNDERAMLSDLYATIMIQVGGNVEDALNILRELERRYGLTSSMTIDDFVADLRRKGLIEEHPNGELNTTSRGDRFIRTSALHEIFRSLKKAGLGNHDVSAVGKGVERTAETRSFTFGDRPNDIDVTQTLTNLFQRTGSIDSIHLNEDDVHVFETEHQTSCATVLLIDISHSMILYGEDRITPAKKVALALAELISTKYPKDSLDVVVFGDEARQVSVNDIQYITVGPFHTNTRDGLRVARKILKKTRHINKQILMITDGKPSALTLDDGRIYKNSFGLDERIVNKTLDEAMACRRANITVSTFMVAQDAWLRAFVEDFTRANKGKAYFTGLDGLGTNLFVDYIRNRRSFR